MKPLKITPTPKHHGLKSVSKEKPSVEVDMNPMVDLAFLLLTFFMLATTFQLPQIMEVIMPLPVEADAPEETSAVKESKALTILLDEEDTLYWYMGITEPEVNRIEFSSASLRRIIVEKQQRITDLVILVKPAPGARFENLVDLLDEMHVNKVARYAIVDFEPSDRALIAAQ